MKQWTIAGALACLVLLASCGSRDTSPDASCVAPYLNDQPPGGSFRGPERTVPPGGTITIHGHWYTDTCSDGGNHRREEPLPPVTLVLMLPGRVVSEVGEFAPGGEDLGFSAVVRVPAGTPAGTATVRDDRPHPTTYEFVVGQP